MSKLRFKTYQIFTNLKNLFLKIKEKIFLLYNIKILFNLVKIFKHLS